MAQAEASIARNFAQLRATELRLETLLPMTYRIRPYVLFVQFRPLNGDFMSNCQKNWNMELLDENLYSNAGAKLRYSIIFLGCTPNISFSSLIFYLRYSGEP